MYSVFGTFIFIVHSNVDTYRVCKNQDTALYHVCIIKFVNGVKKDRFMR